MMVIWGYYCCRVVLDNQTTSSLLQLFCEVITPGNLKFKDIASGIHSWERKISLLETTFNERITENIKLAVLIGMLPKDYQDMAMQNVGLMSDMKYKEVRDYIINVATQRLFMYKPTPMDIDGVWNEEWGCWVMPKETTKEDEKGKGVAEEASINAVKGKGKKGKG